MNRKELTTKLAYNRWANHRLLRSAAALPSEAFSKDMGGSFGSVQGTLLHLLWAEWGWLHHWQHGSFVPDFPLDDFATVAALEESWLELEKAQLAFIEPLTDADLLGTHAVDEYLYTLGELIHHLLNHSTYHRGQVALLLRQLDQKPPSTDFRLFLTESRYGATY